MVYFTDLSVDSIFISSVGFNRNILRLRLNRPTCKQVFSEKPFSADIEDDDASDKVFVENSFSFSKCLSEILNLQLLENEEQKSKFNEYSTWQLQYSQRGWSLLLSGWCSLLTNCVWWCVYCSFQMKSLSLSMFSFTPLLRSRPTFVNGQIVCGPNLESSLLQRILLKFTSSPSVDLREDCPSQIRFVVSRILERSSFVFVLQLIESYCNILKSQCKDKKVYFVPCLTKSKQVFEGRACSEFINPFDNINLLSFDFIIWPCHHNDHYIGYFVDVSAESVTVYDSFFDEPSNPIIDVKIVEWIYLASKKTFSIIRCYQPKQSSSGFSCGPFVLHFFEMKLFPNDVCPEMDEDNFRSKICLQLCKKFLFSELASAIVPSSSSTLPSSVSSI